MSYDYLPSARTAWLLGGATLLVVPGAAWAQTVSPSSQQQAEAASDAAVEDDEDGYRGIEEADARNVIVVTATKREQTLQDVPISVSVTTGETLERAAIRDLRDLQTVTPSLRVDTLQSPSQTNFIIRGFGNGANNAGIEPSVGVFIDGVFRSRTAGQIGDLANISRVEVLRGPQSTLFGKNASAGVISIITREPQFEFGGSVSATYGNYDQVIVKGDVTGPITDSVAFALDGNYNRRDGYVEVVNLDERINERDRYAVRGQLLFDNSGPLHVRAIGDYSKIDELCCYAGNLIAGPTVPAIFAVGGQIVPQDLFADRTFLNVLPENEIESYGGSIQADLELGALTLTSITAYRELRSFALQDVDFTSADVVTQAKDQAIDTFTQELRIASDFDGPINFLLGGFYFNDGITETGNLTLGNDARPFFNLLAGGALPAAEAGLGFPAGSFFSPGLLTDERFTLENESFSVFGTVDFTPTDRLTLTAGFNYTDDKKDYTLAVETFDELGNINLVDVFIVGGIAQALQIAPSQVTPGVIQSFAGNPATAPIFAQIAGLAQNPAANPLLALRPLQFQPPFLGVPNAVEPGRTRDDDFSYTLRAAYDVTDDLNVYFTYATGFKASSVNLSRDSRPLPADFTRGPAGSVILAPGSPVRDAGLIVPNLNIGTRSAGPEEAEVYELGIKAQFDRFGFNLALFDQTLEGFQSNIFTGTGFALANAGRQSTRGFEFDATARPADPLVFTFALTYLDPLFDSFPNAAVGDLSGRQPAGIPEFTIATSGTYTHEFGSSGTLLVGRLDYYHESNTQTNDGLLGFPTLTQGIETARRFRREVNQVNASLALQLANGLELSGYVRNLFDDRHIVTVFDGVAQAGTVSGYPNEPRTYGGTARFRF